MASRIKYRRFLSLAWTVVVAVGHGRGTLLSPFGRRPGLQSRPGGARPSRCWPWRSARCRRGGPRHGWDGEGDDARVTRTILAAAALFHGWLLVNILPPLRRVSLLSPGFTVAVRGRRPSAG